MQIFGKTLWGNSDKDLLESKSDLDLIQELDRRRGIPKSAELNHQTYLKKFGVSLDDISTGLALVDHKETNRVTRNTKQFYQEVLEQVLKVSQSRSSYYQKLKDFDNYYFLNGIYEVLEDDIFQDTGEGLKFGIRCSSNKEYEDEVNNQLLKVLDIGTLLDDIIHPLLHYGEYPLGLKVVYGEGVISFDDKYEAGEVITLYQGSEAIAYFRDGTASNRSQNGIPSPTFTLDRLEKINLPEVVVFSLANKRFKVKLSPEIAKDLNSPYIKMGRSVIWGVIEKLQSLRLRELAESAEVVANLDRPTLVGLQVPDSSKGQKAIAYSKKYESLLNTKSNDPLQGLQQTGAKGLLSTVASMMGTRFKVVPLFGNNKGDLSKLKIEDQLGDDKYSEKITEDKESILNTIGIPPELVSGNGEGGSHLRVYARLGKKVKSIQRSLSKVVKVICTTHIANKYGDKAIRSSDFEIDWGFTSSIEDLDNADNLKVVVDLIQSVLGLQDSLISAGYGTKTEGGDTVPMFDRDQMIEYVAKELESGGSKASKLFRASLEPKIKEIDSNGMG